jgi:hypothetical protein
MTTRFVIVTFLARAIFGLALGFVAKWMSDLWIIAGELRSPVRTA